MCSSERNLCIAIAIAVHCNKFLSELHNPGWNS